MEWCSKALNMFLPWLLFCGVVGTLFFFFFFDISFLAVELFVRSSISSNCLYVVLLDIHFIFKLNLIYNHEHNLKQRKDFLMVSLIRSRIYPQIRPVSSIDTHDFIHNTSMISNASFKQARPAAGNH